MLLMRHDFPSSASIMMGHHDHLMRPDYFPFLSRRLIRGSQPKAPPGQGALCPTGLHGQKKKRQLLPKPEGQGRRNWGRSEAERPIPMPLRRTPPDVGSGCVGRGPAGLLALVVF